MTATDDGDELDSNSIAIDPEAVRGRDDVPVVTDEQVVPPEVFPGVRATYEDAAGVIAVGVVHDGRVLLVEHGGQGLVRGDVRGDESWTAAARRVVAELTGATVRVERPVLLEVTTFQAADGDEWFEVPTVHARASLVDPDRGFVASPTVLDDPAHKYYDNEADLDLGWFESVPADVRPAHAAHVERFLE